MHAKASPGKWATLGLILLAWAGWAPHSTAQTAAGAVAVVMTVKGQVEILRGPRRIALSTNETPFSLQPRDLVKTGTNSHAILLVPGKGTKQLGELTDLEIPETAPSRSRFNLLKGIIYFFHRDEPRRFEMWTPAALAVVLGTEFSLQVEENGRATLALFEGQVEMSNAHGALLLRSGEQAVAEPGQAPTNSPMLEAASDLIQWFLYYPAILDPDELGWGASPPPALAPSLAAYRDGDLLQALALNPAGRQPPSDNEKVYLAALLLSVGQVGKSQALLATLAPGDARPARLAAALRQLIATVKGQPDSATLDSRLSTSLLAESYAQQGHAFLEAALQAATNAAARSPDFGFAHARVAELQFSVGRTRQARQALDRALQLAPRNAQALALKGFLLAAENRISSAIAAFDEAIAIDGGLGNAWLGRGLCQVRRGRSEEGRQDLQVAAGLEPQRAILRSYLGKAFGDAGRREFALKELQRARRLDTNDPTAALYSALLLQQNNRVNEAVRDLEISQTLGDNRRIYRSQFLLDQDRAVRSANLAGIYHDAGLTEVSVREAVRAVNADYANYSAHLFLADSFQQLRDPTLVNNRYETPTLSEYLLANLLAPVGAGLLSPTISQQEYSRLFERDGPRLSSSTEWFSNGDWVQDAAQFGTVANTSYSLEAAYRSRNGWRINDDVEQLNLSLQLKQQITPRNSVWFQASFFNATGGDLAQYADPGRAHRQLRFEETQEPLLFLGYHHEWTPWSHTLFLAGRLQDSLRVTDPEQGVLLLYQFDDVVSGLPHQGLPTTGLDYRSDFEAYTAELQQIVRVHRHSLIAGARFQIGTFDTRSRLDHVTKSITLAGASFTNTAIRTITALAPDGSQIDFVREAETDFQRTSIYAYDQWQLADCFLATVGLSYDRLDWPLNFRTVPNSDSQGSTDQLLPKAGLTWTPLPRTTVRAAYARALGGVSFDQSVRLEPTQVAGFNQAFRSLIPESAGGSIAGEEVDLAGLSLEHKLAHGTYLAAQLDCLRSEAGQFFGSISNTAAGVLFNQPTYTRHRLHYRERNFRLTAHQLIGPDWAFGATYHLGDARLESAFVDISPGRVPAARSRSDAIIQQVDLFAHFNHPSGVFGEFDALWTHQSSDGDAASPDSDFWQFNVFAGYRFPRRRAEVRLGLLNLTDRDYRLNPLNLTAELPRERTFVASFKFNF